MDIYLIINEYLYSVMEKFLKVLMRQLSFLRSYHFITKLVMDLRLDPRLKAVCRLWKRAQMFAKLM